MRGGVGGVTGSPPPAHSSFSHQPNICSLPPPPSLKKKHQIFITPLPPPHHHQKLILPY